MREVWASTKVAQGSTEEDWDGVGGEVSNRQKDSLKSLGIETQASLNVISLTN